MLYQGIIQEASVWYDWINNLHERTNNNVMVDI